MDVYRIGVDENGLGSWLGPLVVTAVLGHIRAESPMARGTDNALDQPAWLGDSKQLVSHRDVRLGEAWARALLSPPPQTPQEVLERLLLGGSAAHRARCPASAVAQCWNDCAEQFRAEPPMVEQLVEYIHELKSRGLESLVPQCHLVCTGELNRGLDRGQHRLALDLHGMETLVLAHRERVPGPILATCGKVGGITAYGRYFGPLAGQLHTVLGESPERSQYEFPRLGRIEFVMNADATDPLVMLASLVGKYVRELTMQRIGRYYADRGVDGPAPSGYHDPVTRRFVTATESVRQRLGVPLACFCRRGRRGF